MNFPKSKVGIDDHHDDHDDENNQCIAGRVGSISRCLHVGNVGIRATEDSLRTEFGKFGSIEDIKIVHQGGMHD